MYIRDLDMDAIVDRYELTFDRQNHDRPLFSIAYGLGQSIPHPPAPATVYERWFNFEWRIDCLERDLENVGFMLEGFPHCNCNLGPDILAACTGSELNFDDERTSWAVARVKDWRTEPPIRFQPDGFYWQSMARFLTLSAERGRGRWLTQSGDLHTNGDGLAALRGPQDLLMDLFDCPDEIHRRLAECHQVFEAMLQAHFDIIHPRSGGLNSSWCAAVCRGKFATIQNDFCCMVGPEQFDVFFKEYIEKEAACVDRCIYHLDGPGAIRHIDSICTAPSLHMIQWVPGAGNKPFGQWPDLLRRIQALGKGLWIHGSAADQLQVLEQVEPEGCMYNLWFKDRAEAEAFLKQAEAILRRKRPARVVRP